MTQTRTLSAARRRVTWLLPLTCFAFAVAVHWLPQSAEAYITIARWRGSSTEYFTSNSLSAAPFPAGTASRVNTAAARWSKPSTGKNFTIVNYNGLFGPTRMYVSSANFGSIGFPNIPGANSLTFSGGYLSSSFLRLNSSWSWNTSCTLNQSQNRADVLTIVLHEMGHSVALNHDPNNTGAVMWPNYVCKQTLRTDDLNGIDALY